LTSARLSQYIPHGINAVANSECEINFKRWLYSKNNNQKRNIF